MAWIPESHDQLSFTDLNIFNDGLIMLVDILGVLPIIHKQPFSSLFYRFPLRVSHSYRTFGNLLCFGRKEMRLEFMNHLNFMLEISQKYIGFLKLMQNTNFHLSNPQQLHQTFQRLAITNAGIPIPPPQLKALDNKFNFTNAT